MTVNYCEIRIVRRRMNNAIGKRKQFNGILRCLCPQWAVAQNTRVNTEDRFVEFFPGQPVSSGVKNKK